MSGPVLRFATPITRSNRTRRRRRHRRLEMDLLEWRCLLAGGLVAAYGFNEGSGGSLGDASGNGNNGTISNATWATGKFGTGLKFSGATNSYVSIPDAPSLDLTGALTIEAWVDPSSLSSPEANWCAAVAKDHPNSSNDISYAIYAATGTSTPPGAHILVSGGDKGVPASSKLTLNSWTHLAATYDGATMKMYVNGTLMKSQAQSGSVVEVNAPLKIGGDWSGEMFAGIIDEVRIYNVALTQSQIQGDMNAPVDSIPPTVAMTAPSGGSTVSGKAVTLSADASDNVGVASVQFLVDGKGVGAPVASSPYRYTWDTTGIANGPHTLAARATDLGGNSSTSAAVSVTVSNQDVTPPSVGITAPAAGASLSGTTTLSAVATDDQAVASVQFQVDGVDVGPALTSAPYSTSWDTTAVSGGAHTVVAIATDSSGNVATASVGVTVNQQGDAIPPSVAITSPAAGAWAGTLTLSAAAADNLAVRSVQFAVDGADVGPPITTGPYQATWSSSLVADGPHTITAKATDTSGNTATSSISIQVVNGGQFGSVINMPVDPYDNTAIVPMNVVLLDNGKILMWDGGPDCLGGQSPTVWDPAAGTFTFVPEVTQAEVRDLFCSAQTVLADGRVLVAGGHDCTSTTYIGTAIANVFDPATGTWTYLPDMHDRRWYPTATTLPNGSALVTAGSANNTLDYDPIPEVYDPVANTWTKLTGASQVIPNYPFMFVLPDGRVFAAGSDEAKMASYVLNVATRSWSVVDPTALDAGSAVQYLPGKVMKAGSSYLSAPADNGGGTPSANTTYVIDMNGASPAWQQTASMANARTHLNLTILPDDTVLATGGSSDIGGVNPAHAVYPAELWSPVTQTWTTMASMVTPRLYHSTALLLPDGRVVVAGGGHNYYNNIAYPSAEIYSPAYLFKGARPTVTSSPSTLSYGSSFFVGTPDGSSIASVALVRNGSVTHSFNMDQSYVPLAFSQTAGGLTVQAPSDANLAPPGYYMLFLVNSNGVPSIAPFVRLPAGYEDTQPPSAPTDLAAGGSPGSVSLSWGAATDNVGVAKYYIYRSTTPGFTPSGSNLIGTSATTGFVDYVAAGTYYYRVAAQDAAGNLGPASEEAAGTSLADTVAPTVSLTAPSAGATVSGTVLVSAVASDNVAVAGVQFLLDGQSLGSMVTTAPYSISWGTTSASNGAHTLGAVAYDASGNQASAGTIAITVSNAAPTGLVASYSFDEGAGAALNDSSGNGNNGAIANASWSAAGKYAGALSFTGATTSMATVPDGPSLHLAKGMTLEAWVNPSSLNSPDLGWCAAIAKDHQNSSNDVAYGLYAASGSGTPPSAHILVSGKDYAAQGASVLPLNAWTFLAATYDGSVLKLYVNGNLAGSKSIKGSITSTTDPLRIGGDWSGEMFTGLIDNVRIYSVALSASQILADQSTAAPALAAAPLSASASIQVTPSRQAAMLPAAGVLAITTLSGPSNARARAVVPSTAMQTTGPGTPMPAMVLGEAWKSRPMTLLAPRKPSAIHFGGGGRLWD
ncbi:Chitodextrinase precursor [Aquisphaera giovannonii]|uniref:Chitodextrinase n=1 Tax=Aquisphaera giovannonii TaxID=406548 RepID=A0A5B9VVL5_9BACT|nr:Ig-like domain-containing protein [Aquisphaera giovannonii]QEH32282.1 Chitodextrinase precursor [Aquisphaera giovannonii]